MDTHRAIGNQRKKDNIFTGLKDFKDLNFRFWQVSQSFDFVTGRSDREVTWTYGSNGNLRVELPFVPEVAPRDWSNGREN